MRSEIKNLREEQELSVKFMAHMLDISEEKYMEIEDRTFEELGDSYQKLFAQIFGVEVEDLKPYVPSPKVISIIGGEGPAKLAKERERILAYRDRINKN